MDTRLWFLETVTLSLATISGKHIEMSWFVSAGVTIAVAGVAMINAGFLNPKIEQASLSYLSGIQLKALDGSKKLLMASDLWTKNGAVIMVVRRPG